ncbi:MAG: transaldolase family protein [Planctomycetota bacterium]
MSDSLQSLIASGTKLWLDSVDPQLVAENFAQGATGATSNPVIIADVLKSGRFDAAMEEFMNAGQHDEAIAWSLTDMLVKDAQAVFLPVWESSHGDNGYVSFELNPLLEDPELGPPHAERVAEYVKLGTQWAEGQPNRMIKVPATPAGLDALEELTARGVTLNVTLIFTDRQYQAARDAVWRGAQRRDQRDTFKSVYSIFVSRIDVYTEQHVPQLSADAQGQVGIVNAKRIWQQNQAFWQDKSLPLQQEIIFASTGTKKPEDDPWKYVAAFAGSDIETNPPSTNAAAAASGLTFERQVDQLPPQTVLAEIDAAVDFAEMERVLMEEGIKKFTDPQRALLEQIAAKRRELATA